MALAENTRSEFVNMDTKRCSKCGAGFGCGAASTNGCWCMDLPRVGPVAPANQDCLCPNCLAITIGQSKPNEGPDRTADPGTSQMVLIEGEDYYLEGGAMVFTSRFLQRRGYCCESGCRHCPYPST